MAYYFMVESKRGQYLPLNIKKSIYFQPVSSKYKKTFAYSLEEIDSFTMMFNNETELRNVLIQEQLLTQKLKHKPLSIRFLTKGEYEKVRYDFLYQKDLEYIADPTRVIKFIMQKYYQNDFTFIQKIASHFSKYHECSSTAPEVIQAANASIRDGKRNYLFEMIDRNGDLLVPRLIKLIILKHIQNMDGTITYKNEVNYRNLHTVIAFINNYYFKNEPTIEQIIMEEFNHQEQSTLLNKPEVKTKTKKKNTTPLEGQLSFPI